MSDSEISFDYDDDSLQSGSEFSDDPPSSLAAPLSQIPPRKSPNFLSSFMFRPTRVLGYILEHFLTPAKALRALLPDFSMDELLVMLQYKKWLASEVTSDYYENWPKLRKSCGLPEERGVSHRLRDQVPFLCPICCNDSVTDVFLLLCGHEYCLPCYSQYVKASTRKGSLIRCMDVECNFAIVPSDVEFLLQASVAAPEPEADVSSESSASISSYDQQFEKLDLLGRLVAHEPREPLLENAYLVSAASLDIDSRHEQYRWCPAVDCTGLAELVVNPRKDDFEFSSDIDLANVAIVSCPNSHEFCFDCQYENHLPCPCWLVKKWVKRCEDDSETANWIEANTQSCPRCHTQIEKNGGCNHMKCQKCTLEFCWICLGDWAVHQSAYWKCNRYDPKEVEQVKKKRSDKQASLSRYLHFYKRFCVHQKSMQGDEKTLRSVHRCMLSYMKAQRLSSTKSVLWNDVQYLSDAIRSLSSGRKTLMWTYAFAFYLEKSNFAEIFEGMQDFLTKTVEDLSSLFEELDGVNGSEAVSRITKRKSDIVNLSALVTRRQHLLLECAHTGLLQGQLAFREL